MRTIFLLLLSVSFFTYCTPKATIVSQESTTQTSKSRLPDTVFSVDQDGDGTYEVIAINEDDQPTPVQGKMPWLREFYTSIKYPAMAREKGIQGIVMLDVIIDANGKVVEVGIGESLDAECDAEALKAFRNTTQQGYTPLVLDGQAVTFKMSVPVGFWLA